MSATAENHLPTPFKAEEYGTVVPLTDSTTAFMSGMEKADGTPRVGNVLRRTCMVVGESACAATCQLAALKGRAPMPALKEDTVAMVESGVEPDRILDEDPTACADNNLLRTFEGLGIRPERALMVGVTADKIGFLDDEATRAHIKRNPHGWAEVAGFNAFFASHNDLLPGSEDLGVVRFLGARLADSGFVVVSMKDRRTEEAKEVSGIIHSTRTNMPGRDHRKEYGGERQSFLHYVLHEAMEHYGARPEDVTVRVTAAVGPESWRKQYPSVQVMESNLPGWAKDGLILNRTNSGWRPGMEVSDPVTGERDVLWPQYPHKVRLEVLEASARLGIEKVYTDEPLDPGKPRNGIVHSSANRRRFAGEGDGAIVIDSRDVYAVVINDETTR